MENKISAYNLLDIIEVAVSKAKKDIEYQYINYIKSYFNKDNTPKLINMDINSKIVSIPEICMTNLNPINIKTVNINFDCGLEGIENNDLMLCLLKDNTKNKININITLNSEDIPESIMRINDMLISEYIP
jgi:hypothetical protein